MKITRISPVTGKSNERNIPITPAQLVSWYDGKLSLTRSTSITEEDREFLRSGMTDACWNELAAIEKDGVV